MKKTNNSVRFLVETTAAVKHVALKRGRLFAMGASIPVRSLASPSAQKWLSAELPAGNKKPWDQAHEIAAKTERDLGHAAFVEPETSGIGESRYSRLLHPRLPAQPRAQRSRSAMNTPGMGDRFGLQGRHSAARSKSPFGPSFGGISTGRGMGMNIPGIPDPLADIMPQIPGDVFSGNTIPEPFGDSDGVPVDLVRKAFEGLAQWSSSSPAKREMFVTEAAQLLASSKESSPVYNSESLLESLKKSAEISGALLKFIS
jgi:hypothetical protein